MRSVQRSRIVKRLTFSADRASRLEPADPPLPPTAADDWARIVPLDRRGEEQSSEEDDDDDSHSREHHRPPSTYFRQQCSQFVHAGDSRPAAWEGRDFICVVPNSVLLIDDEPIVLDVLKIALEKKAFGVVTTTRIADALKLLDTQPFGALLVDKNLPDGNGLDVIRAARTRQPFCACMMMTGYPNVASILEALRLGAVDYLEKPFPQMSLVQEKIRSAIENQRILKERDALIFKVQEFQKAGNGVFERDTEVAMLQQALELAREEKQYLNSKYQLEISEWQERLTAIKNRHLQTVQAMRASSAALANVLEGHKVAAEVERDLREARRLLSTTANESGNTPSSLPRIV
jgi:DNA-binding response OmpR family regulator